MTSSLVGSEMCIRDSSLPMSMTTTVKRPERRRRAKKAQIDCSLDFDPVSYTHLTLPTICSV
eukprot:10040219-Prorocentrum_lima.AAC.1